MADGVAAGALGEVGAADCILGGGLQHGLMEVRVASTFNVSASDALCAMRTRLSHRMEPYFILWSAPDLAVPAMGETTRERT